MQIIVPWRRSRCPMRQQPAKARYEKQTEGEMKKNGKATLAS